MAIAGSDFRGFSESFSAAEEDDDDERLKSEEFGGDSDGFGIDSRKESEEFDNSEEVRELGTELCRIGDQSCSLPEKVFELEDLGSVLSLETWNECLSEEERFALAEFLPDMDEETFGRTLAELFAGKNFHFGSPLVSLLGQLKGGLCDPGIVMYRRGLKFLRFRDHQHALRSYHDGIVEQLSLIKSTLQNCAGYRVKDRIQFLNYGRVGDIVSESYFESDDYRSYLSKKFKTDRHFAKPLHDLMPQYSKGIVKVPKVSVQDGEFTAVPVQHPSSFKHGFDMKKKQKIPVFPFSYQGQVAHYETVPAKNSRRANTSDRNDLKEKKYQMALQADWTAGQGNVLGRSSQPETEKKQTHYKYDGYQEEIVYPESFDDIARHQGKSKFADQAIDISSFNHTSISSSKRYPEKDWPYTDRFQTQNSIQKETLFEHTTSSQPLQHVEMHQDHLLKDDDLFFQGNRGKPGYEYNDGKSNARYDMNVDRSSYPYYLDGGAYLNPTEVAAYSAIAKKKVKKNEYSDWNDNMLKTAGNQPCTTENLQNYSSKAYNNEKRRRVVVDLDQAPQQLYLHDYNGSFLDDLQGTMNQTNKFRSSMEDIDAQAIEVTPHRMSTMSLMGCNFASKKPKWNIDGMYVGYTDESYHLKQQFDDSNTLRKKGKRKLDDGLDGFAAAIADSGIPEKGVVNIESELKPQGKPFTPITPTIHTGFSFSVVHLLSSVRKAMVTPNVDDISENESLIEKMSANDDTSKCHDNDAHTSQPAGQICMPSLTVQEIVSRVRSNPGDPCILETQEPLQDLVRGTLKIFSSKIAPLGAKGWKALVSYDKSNKSWSWVGPAVNDIEEENSPEAWGVPHNMLVKLVDAFANWLKSGQETLQQIGSLPAPPASLFANLDEKERFKDLRAQKSLNTIGPSTDEVRAYFRKEELLRYSIPDRAFSYTATDGKKSIVAPLRRGGGKPTAKAREHFMLKIDRPPHVTILCLVRDAAARLPACLGTRADVCTLIRDSQYIVETVTDVQINQVVSGALDRLHYERDPCVQYDSEKKIWKYLHRDREEEDFDDDGTSSTKKWKRQRKDATDQSDLGTVNDLGHEIGATTSGGSPVGLEDKCDLNIDLSSCKVDEEIGLRHDESMPNTDNDSSMEPSRDERSYNDWENLRLNMLQENNVSCG